MSETYLTFSVFADDHNTVRQWQGRAVSADPESIERLANHFDKSTQNQDQGVSLSGFTVRARRKTETGSWQVCEFTYPMDSMPSTDDTRPPLTGEFCRDVIDGFREYLK